ncbi:unnamed protein product [Phytophthora fragariaefolia]|uniref:Unnamed protein product n=1 Tax=Phytophthora fragariaefolia TaxID=1490495 RepID=A0A9W6WQI4_9STRA|nr:unnamed protein product [Phytophthora fragariaefolia]
MWRPDAARSPQSRHRKRRLLEAAQQASPASERQLVEGLAAQVAAPHGADEAEAVNACVRVLRNAKNSVYVRGAWVLELCSSRGWAGGRPAAARGLLPAQQSADRRHEARARQLLPRHLVVDARYGELQVREVEVGGRCGGRGRGSQSACAVVGAAPSQQRHLQLVVSLDSELLALQSQPVERGSANLLLTVAGRPESGDTSRQLNDNETAWSTTSSEPLLDAKKKTKKKRRRAGVEPPLPTQASGGTNQHSPPRQQRTKVAWAERDDDLDDGPVAPDLPGSSNGNRIVHRRATGSLAADVARRETPNRVFKMERYRVVTPVFPRQYMQDPPLSPLPLIQPTGGHRMTDENLLSEQQDQECDTQDIKQSSASQRHPASDTLLLPKHMLEILRTRRMPIASPAYFQQHLRDDSNGKGEKLLPSRLQVTRWEQWNKRHQNDEDESERDAMTAVATAPQRHPFPASTATTGGNVDDTTATSPTSRRQAAVTKLPPGDLEPMTPAFKRERLREILRSPVEPNEHNSTHVFLSEVRSITAKQPKSVFKSRLNTFCVATNSKDYENGLRLLKSSFGVTVTLQCGLFKLKFDDTWAGSASWYYIAAILSLAPCYVIYTLHQLALVSHFEFRRKFVSTGGHYGEQLILYKVFIATVDSASRSHAIVLQPSESKHCSVCAQPAYVITECENK